MANEKYETEMKDLVDILKNVWRDQCVVLDVDYLCTDIQNHIVFGLVSTASPLTAPVGPPHSFRRISEAQRANSKIRNSRICIYFSTALPGSYKYRRTESRVTATARLREPLARL